MSEQVLAERSKALEEEFFKKQRESLAARLRAEQAQREGKEELCRASGIEDGAILEKLMSMGIRARTLAPLALVPLVEVAWADGKMEPREAEAILEAAKVAGLDPTGPGYELLEGWLDDRPSPGLRDVWAEYTRTLCETLSETERQALQADVIGRAGRVAEAAGGFLGLGSKVSKAEEAVLEELAKAFD
jgi:tellurite resistance protein